MGLSSSCQSTEKSSREETYGELTPRLPGNEFEQVTRLALELAAERLERREPDGARLVGLEDREIGKRDPDAVGELREVDLAIRHDAV